MSPKVVTRRYNSAGILQDGSLVSWSFGLLPPHSASDMFVIDATVSGVQGAGDIGFGVALAEFGGLPVSDVLRYAVVSSPSEIAFPTGIVPGLSGYNGSANVISVGFREPLITNYVVLAALAPSIAIANGCFTVKWFFGFAKEE